MEEEFIDLYTLSARVRDGVAGLFPAKLWVRAEIGSLSVKSAGHCYMELHQSGPDGRVVAKALAVAWASRYPTLRAAFRSVTGVDLAVGQEVALRVQVSYHEVWGFALYVDGIDPSFTLGEQLIKKQRALARLVEDGRMERQKQLAFCALPYRLAIISAEGAAGLGDFRNHLLNNEFGFAYHIDFFPATMQGEAAPGSVVAALDSALASGAMYDAILLLRGGGSDMDLSCFDDYALCAAIADCPVPVITAIGHDKDVHIADMVAFESVKTPTALADLVLSCTAAEDERISALQSRLSLAIQGRLSALLSKVELAERSVMVGARHRVEAEEARLRLVEAKVEALDPRRVLERGYSLPVDSRGVRIASAVRAGERIAILLRDGRIDATVDGTAAGAVADGAPFPGGGPAPGDGATSGGSRSSGSEPTRGGDPALGAGAAGTMQGNN